MDYRIDKFAYSGIVPSMLKRTDFDKLVIYRSRLGVISAIVETVIFLDQETGPYARNISDFPPLAKNFRKSKEELFEEEESLGWYEKALEYATESDPPGLICFAGAYLNLLIVFGGLCEVRGALDEICLKTSTYEEALEVGRDLFENLSVKFTGDQVARYGALVTAHACEFPESVAAELPEEVVAQQLYSIDSGRGGEGGFTKYEELFCVVLPTGQRTHLRHEVYDSRDPVQRHDNYDTWHATKCNCGEEQKVLCPEAREVLLAHYLRKEE